MYTHIHTHAGAHTHIFKGIWVFETLMFRMISMSISPPRHLQVLDSRSEKHVFHICFLTVVLLSIAFCIWGQTPERNFLRVNQGLFPDFMHIMHLACAVDSLTSVLLDLVEEDNLVAGSTRDQRLDTLWQNYRSWAETNGALDVTVFWEDSLVV